MQSAFIEFIYLILITLGFVMLANRLRIAYPIILVVGGLAVSLTGAFSNVTIDPEMVFFIFLPPLLYEAAWQVSWRQFWKFRRIIASFAFPIVILTSCVVAFVSNALIPGFTLALGFLLGGIISPPDAISGTTIMRQLDVPKSLLSITEGESLLNDASSLVVFRFALAAVITGQFNLQDATLTFAVVIIMGIVMGIAIALIFYGIHRLLPTTPSIEIVLTLVTPYCMYYFAEHFHFSGVLAVVSGGLFLSSRRNKILTYESRIQGVNVWSLLGFVLNGIVFMLIGLQLPIISQELGDVSMGKAILYGLTISGVLVVTRLLCTIGASLFTRFISRFITVADANPGWKTPLVFGWAGMRGVVSLAAALSIPLMLRDNEPFPYRNLILFITFIVILVTLVFQGLTLPLVIRKLKPGSSVDTIPEYEQEVIIQKKMAQHSLKYLDEKYDGELNKNELTNNLCMRLQLEANFFSREVTDIQNSQENELITFQKIYLEVLDHQRRLLNEMNTKDEFDEDLIRKYLALIDVEEYKIREKMLIK